MERKFLQIICAIFFCAFSFCFLFFYQKDVMTVAQHIASGGKTFYNPLIGALLITVVLQLLQRGISALVRIPERAFALSYAPSFLLLTLLSSIPSDISKGNFRVTSWTYSLLPVLIVVAFVVYFTKRYEPYALPPRSTGVVGKNTWVNLLIMLGGCLWAGLLSNADPYFHKKAKIERLVDQKRYGEALQVVETLQQTDSATSMLTIYAAARTNQLTSHLFRYPLVGGADVMRPLKVHSLLQPDSVLLKNTKSSANYQLMAFLLKKDLIQFERYLPHYFPADSLYPRYYAEAHRIYSLRLKDSIPAPPYRKDSYYRYYFSKNN